MASAFPVVRSSLRKIHFKTNLQFFRPKSTLWQTSASDSSVSATDDVLYTNDHTQLRASLRKIIEKDINPYVDQWEEEGQFPAHEVFKKLGSAGFLGVTKPTEYGGLGLDFSYSVAVAEELGAINCGAIPMAIGVQTDMATPALASFGSDKVKKEFLAPSITGDKVACLGVSEAGAGSDVASIQTKAVKQGGDYVINGGKMWTTNGFQADWMCLLANTSDGPAHRSKSLICLPMDTKGIHHAKRIDKLGMRSSDTAQIFFEDVRIPQDYIIGEEGMGFTYQMIQFQAERMWAVAAAILPLQAIIQSTIEYTRTRKAFGFPILNNQVVHFTLAELETELELLRSLLYRTVALYVQGNDVTKLASMSKLKAGRLAREITDKCLQFWGGMGFTNEVLISRFYRKMGRFSLFLFMVLFGMQYVTSQKTMPDCPSEEDAMDHDLQIQATDNVNIRLRYTADLSALEGNLSRDILAELTSDSIEAKAEELVSRDILDADLGPVGSAADLDIALPYYWRTCPYRWYVLWRYRWYGRYWSLQSDGTVILEYWWSPWWVWGTYCGASHCHWSYWPFTWVDSRYRCFPDYRLIRLPVYCYRIVFNTSNGIDSFGWLSTWRWRYVWVPRGCCCRKYWWFTISAAATCPAIP